MVRKVIVLDFDKTLTYKDTLFKFFLYSSSKNFLFPFKVLCYYFLMICSWLKLITNSKLKEYGIWLFIKKKSITYIQKISASYSEKIKFNKLYNEFNFNNNSTFYIASASFEDYLKMSFPEHVNIIASQFEYSNDRVTGLKFNCYKENKIKALAKEGVQEIDIFYTDSYSDYSLASISKKIMIVKNDELFQCNGIQDFKMYFGK